MFTPCPHCGFLVALIVARDGAAQRCPRCQHALHADAETSVAAATTQAPEPETPAAEAATAAPTTDRQTGPTTTSAAASDAAVAPAPAVSAAPVTPRQRPRGGKHAPPSFARRGRARAPRVSGRRWPARAAIGVLALALLGQLLLAQRDQLAASARWRPLVAGVCEVLHCDLPPWRQPDAFTMLSRRVQPAPDRPGALLVSASFRNDARWPQPWPRLQLTLSDRNGRPVAQRVFTVAEYRGAAAASVLAPGQSAAVRFKVLEPASPSVAFNFDFR